MLFLSASTHSIQEASHFLDWSLRCFWLSIQLLFCSLKTNTCTEIGNLLYLRLEELHSQNIQNSKPNYAKIEIVTHCIWAKVGSLIRSSHPCGLSFNRQCMSGGQCRACTQAAPDEGSIQFWHPQSTKLA